MEADDDEAMAPWVDTTAAANTPKHLQRRPCILCSKAG
jgi:hypothetical protein